MKMLCCGRRSYRPNVAAIEWQPSMIAKFRELPQWQPQFAAAGYDRKHFFPHRFCLIPKCGPDGYKLAKRMLGRLDINSFWQLVIFATGPALERIPCELFRDDDLMWHRQQFNHPGQIATAALCVDDRTLYTKAHHSDLVQRISRHREAKTRVEKIFKGWHRLMLNCIANFAIERDLDRICVPTAKVSIRLSDRERYIQPELFERVYDRAINHHFKAHLDGGWWQAEIADNRDAVMTPEIGFERIEAPKTICLCHDIERGMGHRADDPEWAAIAERDAPARLDTMLAIERAVGVRATYNVLGCLLGEVRERIEQDGHCVAFHSFDHGTEEQLAACRRVDYRIKGYRPPNSAITPELRDSELCWYNFEWLASGSSSLGFHHPRLENRVVKIPISFDDYDLHRGRQSFEEWRRMALDKMRRYNFVAFSLHDCYAPHWLPHYASFLREVRALGNLRTLDEVASDLYLAAAA
jgi:hypothetical protein